MPRIDLTLPPPIMKNFYIKEMNIRNDEIPSSFLSSVLPSYSATVELHFSVKKHLLDKIANHEDIIKAMVSDYLHTNYDGLTLKQIEEDYPEYGL